MFEPVNYLAILVAAVVHFVFGALWYGLIFAKKWMEMVAPDESKMEQMKKGAAVAYIINFLAAIVLSYVTARFIAFANPADILTTLLWMLLLWAGYSLIFILNDSLFEKKPWGLFLINAIYALIGIEIVGAILFYWR